MNTNKKVSLLVVIALVTSLFSSCLTAFAEQHYTDVDDSHWASAWVNYMHEKGYIHGYSDGTYLPGNNITRAEFVTILNYITKSTTPAEISSLIIMKAIGITAKSIVLLTAVICMVTVMVQ